MQRECESRQVVESSAKGGPGPSRGVKGQLRWAVVRVCEGGGALHTEYVLSGKVLVI